MIPKKTKVIKTSEGYFCKTCNKYLLGDLDQIKKKHTCYKTIKRRRFILFGKVITKNIPIEEPPNIVKVKDL